MELKFILEKLKGQKSDLKFANLDIWLPTTYQYIEDHFRSYSSRATTFYNLIQEYNVKKASSNTILVGPFAFDYIKNKAEGFLSEIISVLEHEYEQQQTAAKITADNIKKQQEHLAKLTATQEKQTPSPTKHENLIPPPEPKVIIKTQLPFGIKAEFFWGIMVVIIGFSYWLGTKWENFELRDEVKTLKLDTTSKGGRITQYESAAETKNKMIGSIRDSLNKSKKSLDSIIKGSKTSN